MTLIRVRLNKATLYFTPQELTGLLEKDPALWLKAIKRGKAIRRAEAARKRPERPVVRRGDREVLPPG